MRECVFNGRYYEPVTVPCGDNEELSDLGDRLMFIHSPYEEDGGSRLFIAPMGTLYSGYVLGVFIDE